jgi:hypothetical protein
VQPGEAALDDQADLAQAGAVGDAKAGDARDDPAGAQQPALLVEIVAPVGEQLPAQACGEVGIGKSRLVRELRDRL